MNKEENGIAESISAKLIPLYCFGKALDYLPITVRIGVPSITTLSSALSIKATTLAPCSIRFK